MTAPPPPLIYASGQLEIDLAQRELRVRGIPVPIGGRAFEIIEVIVQAAGALVTKDELMERVWPGAIVEENTLQVHISAVRKALGPDRGMLRTLKGRGYRLLGTWDTSQGTTPSDALGTRSAAPSIAVVSNNLPPPGTSLIGRAEAMQQLQDLLSAYRVITLTGPGGIGKTKLAVETARHMLAQSQGEVWLVELASLSDPELVPSAVASALGLRLGIADISRDVVARAIGQRKILLLLDNCEHVIDAAAMFAETMLRLCPHATILATSREVLRIDGEYVSRVPPLDVPHRQEAPSEIAKHSAVQLFVTRTTAMSAAFVPDGTTLPDVAGICQHLDGIPLAIEFAAARAAMIGVSQVATHLDDRFSLLTAGRRTTLARHQTLRAALDWSYNLLTAAEQRLFRHLSIFPAGFTAAAATAVTGDTIHGTTVIDGIENLVAKSLVALDESAPGGRWRLLETIRAYAFEQLREYGEAEGALRRHAEFFRDLLTPAELVSCWEPAQEALIQYSREIDNIRAAIDWCFSPAGQVSIGIAITAAFVPVWFHFALVVECRRRTESALAHLPEKPNGDEAVRALLYIGLGVALNHTGAQSDQALTVLATGLRVADGLGDALFRMYALWALWATHCYRGNYRATQAVAEEFSRLAAESGDPARGYLADRLMGTTMLYRGDQPRAREHLDRVERQYHRSLGRPQAFWFGYNLSDFAQSHLARVLCLRGYLDQARDLAQTCIDRTRVASQKLGLCYSLVEAACPIALMLNDLDAAARHVALLVSAASTLDLSYWKNQALCMDGVLLVRQGNNNAGATALRTALAACDEGGGISGYPAYLGAIAEALSALGRLTEARTTLDQALTRADLDGEEWCIPDLLCTKGELALRELGPSSANDAEDCFKQALAIARKQGALLWQLRSALHLTRLRAGHAHPDGASRVLASIYCQFVEGFETADLRAAKMLLGSPTTGRSA